MRKLEWYNAKKVSPSNRERVLVELADGNQVIAWQEFGEWITESEVIRWRYIPKEKQKVDG